MAKTPAERMRASRERKRNRLRAVGSKGIIYVIQCGNLPYYKIGMTTSGVDSRLASLQTGSPLPLRVLFTRTHYRPVECERFLHDKFKHVRMMGEWFRLSFDELMDLAVILGHEHREDMKCEYYRDLGKIDMETYDVPVICDEYDADDIRQLMGDPAYEGAAA